MERSTLTLWALLAYFGPMKSTLLLIFVLFILDFLTGIRKAMKQGKKITSRKLRDSADKLAAYCISLVLCFYLTQEIPAISDTHLPANVAGVIDNIIDVVFPIVYKVVAIGIVLTECISIFENLSVIAGSSGGVFNKVVLRLKKTFKAL